MGGHGGLNILPQKRWNVYNYDNRAKVERDKKRLHEKRNQEQDVAIKKESNSRLEDLRTQRYTEKDVQYSTNGLRKEATSEAVKKHQKSIIEQEMRETKPVEKKKKGVNLFEAEEEMQAKEIQQKIDMQTEKFFEGKPYEMDTKFGGNFKHQPAIPWYSKPAESDQKLEQNENPLTPHISQQIQDFRSKKSTELFKVIDFSSKEERKHHKHHKYSNSRSRSRSPKHVKSHKKDKKELKKKQIDTAVESAKSKMQKLRDERAKREKEESLKQRSLFRENQIV